MPSTLPRIPVAVASRHYGSLADAILAARDLLRSDKAARHATVRGVDNQGRVVEAVLRSANGPARRRVLAIVGAAA